MIARSALFALAKALERERIGAVVFGALADKAWPDMLRAVATIAASAAS